MPRRRKKRSRCNCGVLVDIILHTGAPCQRDCICRYFSNIDKAYFCLPDILRNTYETRLDFIFRRGKTKIDWHIPKTEPSTIKKTETISKVLTTTFQRRKYYLSSTKINCIYTTNILCTRCNESCWYRRTIHQYNSLQTHHDGPKYLPPFQTKHLEFAKYKNRMEIQNQEK